MWLKKFFENTKISYLWSPKICMLFVGIECYKPANGETVTIETKHNIPVDISLKLLKREASLAGEISISSFFFLAYKKAQIRILETYLIA